MGPRVKGAAARAAADEAAAGPAGPGAALATLVLSKAEAALGKADGAAEAAAQVRGPGGTWGRWGNVR